MIGVCLDALNPAGRPGVRSLRAFSWVRLVGRLQQVTGQGLRPHPLLVSYCARLHAAGIDTALVLARESLGDNRRLWRSLAQDYVWRCRPTAIVIGNEPDAYLLSEPSPSSWSMEPDVYIELAGAVGSAIGGRFRPRPLLIGAGLVSGQPFWLEAIPSWITKDLDGWDIHPYGKGLAEAGYLLMAYLAYASRLYVLEWNRPAAEIPAYLAMLQSLHAVDAACYFCWSDGMVPGFGLLDAVGKKTPEYWALRRATRQ